MIKSAKILTLLFIIQDNKILLGFKKRGFGMGHYNGFGGKVDPDETIIEAVRRETFEEAGIDAHDPIKVGVLNFQMPVGPELQIHIFITDKFSGQIAESGEMRPEWFAINKIPYKKMWLADAYWLPLLLDNKKFTGRFVIDSKDHLSEHTLSVVDKLED